MSCEHRKLVEEKNSLIVEMVENKRILKESEDKLLEELSSSTGVVLEDQTIINAKTLVNKINEKQLIIKEIETKLHAARLGQIHKIFIVLLFFN